MLLVREVIYVCSTYSCIGSRIIYFVCNRSKDPLCLQKITHHYHTGKSITEYKHAWYTILHSKTISLEEKRELVAQSSQLTEQTRTECEHQLALLKKDPHYRTTLKVLGVFAASSYLLSSLVAYSVYKINLPDPRAYFFFFVSK